MKNKLIYTFLLGFLSASLFIVSKETLKVYSLFSEHPHAIIEESNGDIATLPVHNVVNYFTNESLAIRFLVSQNEIIEAKYGDASFPLELTQKPNVCVLDTFTREDDEFGFKASHGDFVSRIINKRYDGDIMQFSVKDVNYQRFDFQDCDVINYSMAIHDEDRTDHTFNQIEQFMKTYEGLIVVAGGNEDHTSTKSEWSAYLHARGEDKPWTNRVIIVAQGTRHYTKEKVEVDKNVTSYGEEIDLIVFNGGEYIDTYDLYGSSFAAPVVTSVVAHYLAAGVPITEIKELLVKSNTSFTDEYGFTYTNFQVNRAYEQLIRYLTEQHIPFKINDM